MEKFHYLKSSLKSEALKTIESLEVTEDNYAHALRLLKQRYQNKKLIVHSHIKAIFQLPQVQNQTVDLRKLLDGLQRHVRSLKTLKRPVDTWDDMLIYVITSKFDYSIQKDWEEFISTNLRENEELPKLSHLETFLQNKCQFLEKLHDTDKTLATLSVATPDNKQRTNQQTRGSYYLRSSVNVATNVNCPICNQSHQLYGCKKFIEMTTSERRNQVKKLKLCYNCFKPYTQSHNCTSGTCKKCHKPHNTMLHEDRKESQNNTSTETPMVQVQDKYGRTKICRALLDDGSESNLITEKMFNILKLKAKPVNVIVEGIFYGTSHVRKMINVQIKSQFNALTTNLPFLVVTEIRQQLPSKKINIDGLQIPPHIQLADAEFHKPREVDMLIGAEICYDLEGNGKIRSNTNSIIYKETLLGWIVVGRLKGQGQVTKVRCTFLTNTELDSNLRKFWEIEEVQQKTHFTHEEKECETHFAQTMERLETGRFMVRLPFKEKGNTLGDSRETAEKRFYYLEHRLKKDDDFRESYSNFMQEYIDLEHMKEVDEDRNGYFFPHHAVVKKSSLTTKLRVVFDALARTTSGKSLNDILKVGPVVQEDLLNLLLRFRMHRYVLTADIEKMYRQIRVHSDDTKYQRVLWRPNKDQDIKTFEMQVVTFGVACSPYLATRCLLQLAEEEAVEWPTAADVLKHDFYVDDLLTGTKTKEEALSVADGLNTILNKGCFKLRKWRSNDPDILEALKDATQETDEPLILDKCSEGKTLGIVWNSKMDTLIYAIKEQTFKPPVTKRKILSRIAQIHDPLGLLGPIITSAKLILQRLWREGVDWDEEMSPSILLQWEKCEDSLQSLKDVEIPRHVIIPSHERIQLQGCSDASQSAYGACIYARSTHERVHKTHLLIAKSRVAPLKPTTIPRLELCAALLLARLMEKVKKAIKIPIEEIYYWTDSQIVLAWITSPAGQWKQFVSNRVSEIQEISQPTQWHYIRSEENPADAISRGLLAQQLKESQLWWHGPVWFKEDESTWPIHNTKKINVIDDEREEQRKVTMMVKTRTAEPNYVLAKFGTFSKLQRVIAYCFRFVNNCRKASQRIDGQLTPVEVHKATTIVIKIIQEEAFSQEISDISKGKSVSKHSPLYNLCPFLDKQNILRVGGRLNKTKYSTDKKNPILLPKGHFISQLIMRDKHIKALHCGPEHLLSLVREVYWPIHGRSLAKMIVRKCITCLRQNPKPVQYLMADLPEDRTTQTSRPFFVTGVDYAGPINLIETRRRGQGKPLKGYIAVFVCLATTAVHLELVSSLSTEAFLQAFRRFSSRRGACSTLYSDNATNFIGGNRELKEIHEFMKANHDSLRGELLKSNIEWKFIPPRSPHFGGLWESAVKHFKRHFYKVTNKVTLTLEECFTLLAQIEFILNSRPLCPLSSDPSDLSALTPAHFIFGDPSGMPLEYHYDVPFNRLSRWEFIQQLKQHFWSRWRREFLQKLQHEVNGVSHFRI